MKRPSVFTARLFLLAAAGAGVFGLGFFVAPQARAVVLTHPPVFTPSENSGTQWSVGSAAGGAIVTGSLEFDVTGLSQAHVKKHQLFAMFDAAQPTAYANHGYWIQFRKRAQLPGDGPGFQFKLQIDCSWDEDNTSIDPAGWIPDRVYHFTFSWDSVSTKVAVQDTVTGRTDISELPLPSPFKAQDQAIVFGSTGLAGSGAFPAEPGARYDNISLNAIEVTPEFDDFDGYPKCEFDGGCGCVTGADSSEAPCSETSSTRPPEPGDEPFTTSKSGLRWQWDASEVDYFEWRGNNENEQPEVAVQAMTAGLLRGEEAAFTAMVQNFRTRPNNMYYAWCVRDSLTGKTANYNSVLAGGLLAETSTLEQATDHGQCCEWITRRPIEDTDHDGMDDGWERIKFIDRAVPGQRYTTIEEVLPDADPDQDGSVMDRFVNTVEGVPVTIVAGLIDSLGNKYVAGGADRKLSNVEEYILGTDPLNGDTDGDGYVDEADYLGEGQSVMKFTPEQAVGLGFYEVQVSTVGISGRKKTYVAMGSQRIYPSLKGKFEISLTADRDTLPVGADDRTKVILRTEVTGGEAKSEELDYHWTFQGENVCDEAKYPELNRYCDFNQGQIELGGSGALAFKNLPGMDLVEEGGDYIIGVRVIDSASRQDANAQVRLKRGAALTFTTMCAGESVENVTVTSGAARTICLSDYGTAALDPKQAIFTWVKDGQVDQRQSGVGRDKFELTATKPMGDSHLVNLSVLYGATAEKALTGSITIPVVGASVRINQPAERIEAGDLGEAGGARLIRVAPGEQLTLGAVASGFGAGAEYQWSWQGEAGASGVNSESSFVYLVPAGAPLGQAISINVLARGREENGGIIDAGDTISLLVGESHGKIGAGGGWAKALAAMISIIPPQYQTSWRLMALIAGAFAALIGGLYLFSRVTSKR